VARKKARSESPAPATGRNVWVDFPGATYVEHDAEAEILPGSESFRRQGNSAGHQIVVVETDEGPVVLGGDVGHSFEELERGHTEGRRLVLKIAAPTYLGHVAEPRVPKLHAQRVNHRGLSTRSE
jgi:hypothetical protein